MVRTSGIREKFRSGSLRELAKERGIKRAVGGSKVPSILDGSSESEQDDEKTDQEIDRLEQERRAKRARQTNNSLLSILPEPKHSSSFGPTVRLDKLLRMPERADEHLASNPLVADGDKSPASRRAEDGILEVDVSKTLLDATPSVIKDLTIEKSQPGRVVLPKGKEKQKNQITYLAQLGKANELERKEQAAQSRLNKAAARSKYGW